MKSDFRAVEFCHFSKQRGLIIASRRRARQRAATLTPPKASFIPSSKALAACGTADRALGLKATATSLVGFPELPAGAAKGVSSAARGKPRLAAATKAINDAHFIGADAPTRSRPSFGSGRCVPPPPAKAPPATRTAHRFARPPKTPRADTACFTRNPRRW